MNLQATGVESSNNSSITRKEKEAIVKRVLPGRQHLRLIQVTLHAQTDFHNELVHESEWLLHPGERKLRLRGNLFVLEDTATNEGWIFIKEGPLPDERAVQTEADLAYLPGPEGHELHLLAHSDEGGRYPWTVLTYQGGRRGCARALHGFQRSRRAGHPPELLTNTWGDRSQDSRIRHAFVINEVSNLQADLIDRLAPLVALWREYRSELTSGDILTIGDAPDGWAWTGFASVDPEDRHMHLLVFRESNASETFTLHLPTSCGLHWEVNKIYGSGSANMADDNALAVQIPEMRAFIWQRLQRLPA